MIKSAEWKRHGHKEAMLNLYICIYIYILSKAHSKRCFKNSIDTQRKTLLVNVSA